MMAPGLPEVAQKYNETNSTIIAMTLVIFVLSFGLGVSTSTLIFLPLLTLYSR